MMLTVCAGSSTVAADPAVVRQHAPKAIHDTLPDSGERYLPHAEDSLARFR